MLIILKNTAKNCSTFFYTKFRRTSIPNLSAVSEKLKSFEPPVKADELIKRLAELSARRSEQRNREIHRRA